MAELSVGPMGCDTFVVLPPSTDGKYVIFGKNSDRPSDEVQEVLYVPAKDFPEDAKVQCTYIEIPQVAHTHSVVLSKPSWMWGAEMGANEQGVVVGNEAVFTTLMDYGYDIQERLLGMDLLRLSLERGKTAREAMDVTTKLLETHGQGGPCSEDNPRMTYHNSFLFADRKEAWVLETAGEHWVAQKIEKGLRNISNNLTITTKFDEKSANLESKAKEQGWDGVKTLNFGETFSASGQANDADRQIAGHQLMRNFTAKTGIGPREMMSILRDEPSGICMGRGCGFTSTGSQVSVLPIDPKLPCIHFFTGTPDPSISGFKPFVFDGENTIGSNVVVSPEIPPEKDPAKQIPRFKRPVDRKHELYRIHDNAMSADAKSTMHVLQQVHDLEEMNMGRIMSYIKGGKPVANLGEVFAYCVDRELGVYSK